MAHSTPDSCDVAIVGGGPAGLAAATELRRLDVGSITVLDREPDAGGIPRHCGHYPFGMREFHRLLRGPDYAARLVAKATSADVTILTRTTVTALLPGPRLILATPDGERELMARRVLLATGVREQSRAARLIGGSKPGGVISTGALQGLVYLDHMKPFRRPVVLGTELVSFSALLTCRHAGIQPAAMVEPNRRTTAYAPSVLLPRLLSIPLMLDTDVTRVIGETWVEALELRDRSGVTRILETDGLIVSGQFLPESTLVRESHLAFDKASGGPEIDQYGRCSDPDYFAAGNLLRPVETAGWSWAEGCSVAQAIAASLKGRLRAPVASLRLGMIGDALKYAIPQRIVSDEETKPGHRHIQLRVHRPVRAQLAAMSDGREVWHRTLTALPERRILVPLAVLPKYSGARVSISLKELPT